MDRWGRCRRRGGKRESGKRNTRSQSDGRDEGKDEVRVKGTRGEARGMGQGQSRGDGELYRCCTYYYYCVIIVFHGQDRCDVAATPQLVTRLYAT